MSHLGPYDGPQDPISATDQKIHRIKHDPQRVHSGSSISLPPNDDRRAKRTMSKRRETPHSQTASIHHTTSKAQPPGEPAKSSTFVDPGEAYYQSTLWWFTSVAFPLIAGTFGPIANLFSICGLVQSWRISKTDGSRVGDPGWLLALNIASLVLALLANILLLFNFAKRIPYRIAQPFTIIFWYLSFLLLLIPICIGHTSLLLESPSYALSENYYYALIACILYFIISTLLLLNVLGASRPFNAYPPSFAQLSAPQRTLMLQTILFSAYLALGGGIFSAIEGWNFVDGVYWADYTLLTIGLGSDFPVTKTGARMVLIPYAALGIVFVGLIATSVRGLVLERGKARITKRNLEKERARWEKIIDRRDVKAGKKVEGGDEDSHKAVKKRIGRLDFREKAIRQFSKDREKACEEEHPSTMKEKILSLEPHDHKVWRRREFELMRYIEKSAEKMEGYIALGVSVFVFALVWVGGSLVFWACERDDSQWTYPAALYFTYTSILTIGYGDLFPTTNATRPFFVIWSLVAVPAVTVLISNMGETVVQWIQEGVAWLGKKSLLPEKMIADVQEEVRKGDEEEGGGTRRSRVLSILRGGIKEKEKEKETRERTISSSQSSPVESMHTQSLPSPITTTATTDHQTRTEGTQTLEDDEGSDHKEVNEGTQTVEDREHQLSLSIRLAREITSVSKDASQVPPIRYAWNDWWRWLKMMDEAGETLGVIIPAIALSPREPPMADRRENSSASVEVGSVGTGNGSASASVAAATATAAATEVWKWTWLDDQGPLFSPETETQWVLNKLCMLLEKVVEKEAEALSTALE